MKASAFALTRSQPPPAGWRIRARHGPGVATINSALMKSSQVRSLAIRPFAHHEYVPSGENMVHTRVILYTPHERVRSTEVCSLHREGRVVAWRPSSPCHQAWFLAFPRLRAMPWTSLQYARGDTELHERSHTRPRPVTLLSQASMFFGCKMGGGGGCRDRVRIFFSLSLLVSRPRPTSGCPHMRQRQGEIGA